jgi:hypothetical protein
MSSKPSSGLLDAGWLFELASRGREEILPQSDTEIEPFWCAGVVVHKCGGHRGECIGETVAGLGRGVRPLHVDKALSELHPGRASGLDHG